jgi:hypothetical protein
MLQFSRIPIEDEFLESETKKDIQETPLPFSDTTNPILAIVGFLSTQIHTEIGSASAKAAQDFYEKEIEKDITKMDMKEISLIALNAASLSAKNLALQDEREMKKLIIDIIGKQYKKLEYKSNILNNLEVKIEHELSQIKLQRDKLLTEKAEFLKSQKNN